MADVIGFPHGARPGDPYDTMPSECNPNDGPAPLPDRIKILDQAAVLIACDRHAQYGEAKDNLGLTAYLWSPLADKTLSAHDVAIMNCLQKISRILMGHRHKDNYVDLAGYAALAGELAEK